MYKIKIHFSFRKFTDIFSLSGDGESSTLQCSKPSITDAVIAPAVSNIDANKNYTVTCRSGKTLQSQNKDVGLGSIVLVCTNGALDPDQGTVTCVAAGKSIQT